MSASSPFVTVVVPTYNRPEPLRRCLQALAAQDYAPDAFEIIVVNDGGESPIDGSVRIVDQENQGPAAARNRGAKEAGGEYIAFTDDDCMPRPDWLRTLIAELASGPDLLVGGQTANVLTDNAYAAASQHLISYLYRYYNEGPSGPAFFTSNNMAMPRTEFLGLGGFDTSFERAAGEDREFCRRWLASGRSMRYVAEAVVEHAHALNPYGFWRQHFNYGRAAFEYHNMAAERDSGSLTPEPIRFYLDLLAFPLTVGRGFPAFRESALLALSQFANAAGYGLEVVQHQIHRGQRNRQA